jgi:hypothetical protein
MAFELSHWSKRSVRACGPPGFAATINDHGGSGGGPFSAGGGGSGAGLQSPSGAIGSPGDVSSSGGGGGGGVGFIVLDGTLDVSANTEFSPGYVVP